MLPTKKTIVDLMIVASAALLGLAPWIFGFNGQAATWSACLGASVIVIAPLTRFAGFADRVGEIILAIGLWIVLCPLVVGFVRDEAATLVHMLLGIGLVGLALTGLATKRRPTVDRQKLRRYGFRPQEPLRVANESTRSLAVR